LFFMKHFNIIDAFGCFFFFKTIMFYAIFTGISIGLGLAVSVGPYFLFLVNTAIREGRVGAGYLAFGVALNDLVFLTVAFLSAGFLARNLAFIEGLRGFAGFFILGYGLYTMFKNTAIEAQKSLALDPKEKAKNIFRGFVFNGLNPSVFVFWFATASLLISKAQFSKSQTLVAFVSIVCTTFGSDLVKVYLADFFAPRFTKNAIKKVNRVVGFLLILAACYLLGKAFGGL
jgi:threonine/homoserine/homoserine lactone efflux protein